MDLLFSLSRQWLNAIAICCLALESVECITFSIRSRSFCSRGLVDFASTVRYCLGGGTIATAVDDNVEGVISSSLVIVSRGFVVEVQVAVLHTVLK